MKPARAHIQSIEIQVWVTNQTSGLPINKKPRIETSTANNKKKKVVSISQKKDNTVQLVELTQYGVALEVPKRTCTLKHKLLIEFDIDGAKNIKNFVAKGEVVELTSIDPSRDRVDITFVEWEEASLEKLIKAIDGMQDEIDKIMNMVKGEE